MRKTVFCISALLIGGLAFHSCSTSKHAKAKRLPGVWQSQAITIDGNSNDWPAPYPEYDSKASLGYAVSNDKENLYITVETGDQATQLKILRNGLTVWIDKTGGKEQTTAINYPIPRTFTHGKKEAKEEEATHPSAGHWGEGQNDGQRLRISLEDRVKKLVEEAQEFSLQGFRACNSQFSIMQKDSCGIMVRIGLDETNELVWEAVIPFKTFYSKGQIDKRDKGKPMSICIETTGLDRPSGGGASGRGYGSRGGGGGMRPAMSFGMGGMGMRMGGGGMGRGGGYGGSQNNTAMESMYKSTETWKKFGLAWQE